MGFTIYIQVFIACTAANVNNENGRLELLTTEILQLKDMVNILSKENNDKNKAITNLENEVKNLRKEIQIQKADNFVSFTAYATIPRNYQIEERIIFDGVLRNYGGYYDAQTYQFNCPASGYYMFYMNLYSDDGVSATTEFIVMGDEPLTTAFSPNGYNSGSNFAVSFCEEGQYVWVKSTLPCALEGSDARVTTFSGTLLQIVN